MTEILLKIIKNLKKKLTDYVFDIVVLIQNIDINYIPDEIVEESSCSSSKILFYLVLDQVLVCEYLHKIYEVPQDAIDENLFQLISIIDINQVHLFVISK